MSGIVIIIALRCIFKNRYFVAVAACVCALACFATTRPLDWGHRAFAKGYVDLTAPSLPPDALVIIVSDQPVGYVVPFFDKGVRWVSINSNMLRPTQNNLLMARARQFIKDHVGPLYVLEARSSATSAADAILNAVSVERSKSGCDAISSNLGGEVLNLCPVNPVGK